MDARKHQIVIIGAGTAGITIAAQLMKKDRKLDVVIIDPAEHHYYQPAFTLVGAGTFRMKDTIRRQKGLIPKGIKYIKDEVVQVLPESNEVHLKSGQAINYDYLIPVPGIQINLGEIEGLEETLGKNGVCSNYTDPDYTWEVIKNFKGGQALFTQASTPIKCGGAPQKIMYLAEDYFRKQGIRNRTQVGFVTNGSMIFGVPDFRNTLEEIIDSRGMVTRFFHKLVKIDGPAKKAYFKVLPHDDSLSVSLNINRDWDEKIEGDLVKVPFDMLHLAPPQSAPEFIRDSTLAHQEGPNKGWIEVDQYSMQHKRFKNVFAVGDSAALPTAKTGAAIRKQAPVLVGNLLELIKTGRVGSAVYNGYSSCPIVTRHGRMLLAEFGYDNVRMSDPFLSKIVDTTKESWLMWLLKKYGLPIMYWDFMLKGRA